jgi:hypothetical protein
MTSYFLFAGAVGVIGFATAWGLAAQGRAMAWDHVLRLRQMKMQNDQNYELIRKVHGNASFAVQRRKDGDAWFEREVAIQEAWLKRPFYRQLGLVPFPDYAGTK